MFSDHLGLYLIGIDIKMLGQMKPEAQAIEEGAGAQHAIMPSAGAGNVGERIGRIGYNQYDGARRRAHDLWNDVAVDFRVLSQEPQSAPGIIAVRGAAGFLVYAGGNHHQVSIRQIFVISIDNGGLGAKRRSVTQVGRNRLRAFARSVDEHDYPGTAANHGRERARTANPSRTNDSNLHNQTRIRKNL